MKRAIAMKCTQEQFDRIKGKLGNKILSIGSFDFAPYLVNNINGDIESIGNILRNDKPNYCREVHENWNEQIFLEACGIEVEKVEYHYEGIDGEWHDVHKKIRIKPKYSKEIEKIETLAKEIGYKVKLEKL